MQLLIAGDLVPTESNIELFKEADAFQLLGEELRRVWDAVDYRIFNLETPLVDIATPIDKCGLNLAAATDTITGIAKLNPSLISLANNHIFDHGMQGLQSTIDLLKNNGISYCGAGMNAADAKEAFTIYDSGEKIGVYACAEHEFSIATSNSAGANPFDPLESLDHIYDLKKDHDFVIVLYHGGKEHYRYPSPYLQKVCRKMVEKGADLVVCQHSHCVGCSEEYQGSTIVYGQGNFIFDHSESEYWQTSLLIKVAVNKEVVIEYIPLIKYNNSVRLATGNVAEEILGGFRQRSEEISNPDIVESKYHQFALDQVQSYLRILSGTGKWMSRIDRKLLKGFLINRKYSRQQLLAIQNCIECEAHSELMLKGIKEIIEN